MLKSIIRVFLFVFCVLLLTPWATGQTKNNALDQLNDTLSLDPKQFIDVGYLKQIKFELRNSPVILLDCVQQNCGKIGPYRDAMYNLLEDVLVYEAAVNASADIYHDQWEIYLNQNYNNERLKTALITFLGIKDLWTGTSTILLDLVSAQALFSKNKDIGSGNLDIFLQVLDHFDTTLSRLNILTKGLKGDGNDGLISTVAGDNLDNAWDGLKSALDAIRVPLKEYQRLRPQLQAIAKTKGALKTAKGIRLSQLTRQSKGNIAAAIGKLLVVYSNIERNEMKQAIAELDKVLDANQHVQSDYFQLYQLQRQLLDEMAIIKRIINSSINLLYIQAAECGAGLINRADRKYVEVGDRVFGNALRYYKGILEQTAATISNSWKGIKPCVPQKGKPYQFEVFNGLENNYQADISIESKESGAPIFRGKTNNANPIYLFPGTYKISIAGQDLSSGSMKTSIARNSYPITGNEISELRINPTGRDSMHIVRLKPYSRLYLAVVNQNREPMDFGFSITNSENGASVMGSSAFGSIPLDLPARGLYDVEVSYGSYAESKKGVAWPANTAKTLRFEFNNEEGEFLEDTNINTPLDQIDETGVTNAQKEKEKQKGIPNGWVEGRFYNANNVSCQYAGKSLVFVKQGSEILNIQTGKINEGVIVPAGQSIAVAVSNRGGFFRAFISTDASNSEARGRSISFVTLDNLYKGWWFAAGCEHGSKPATNCNNGNGLTDYGSSCKTLGEDY